MILACQNINKAFGTNVILKDASFHIEEKEKAAIVGINGAGKSTLLKIIMKQIPADSGEVILAKDRTIGYLAQHEAVSSGNTIYEELLEVKQDIFELERHIRTLELQMKSQSGGELEQTLELYNRLNTEFEQKNGYACKSEIVGVLKGLGFTEDEFSKQVDTLSGGQKTRVALGKLLLAKPDLILAGGDMLVGKAGRDWTAAADLMKKLPQIAPVWCCNGNHEQRMHEQQEIYGKEYGYYENELKKAGIHVLVNGSEEIAVNGMKLRLYGMELPFGCYKKGWKVCPLTTGEMEERIGSAETDAYCILMAHHPLYAETYWKWGADLVLAGHVHGGMVRVPIWGKGVVSPNVRLFPKYDGGEFTLGKTRMLLSRGLGMHTIPIRLFNPGEVLEVDLLPVGEEAGGSDEGK